MNTILNTIFINREREIESVKSLVFTMTSQARSEKPVLYFYGTPLIGKSTLLRKIQDDARAWGVPTALIDFDYLPQTGAKELAIDLWEKTYQATGLGIADSRAPAAQDDEGEVAGKIINYLKGLPDNIKILWLLDTLEEADSEAWQWLREKVVEPAIQTGRVGLVIAARMEPADLEDLGFSFGWPFQRAMQVHELQPFNFERSRHHFEKLTDKFSNDKFQTFFRLYTGGVPGLNEKISRYSGTEEITPGKFLEKELKPRLIRSQVDDSDILWRLAHILAAFRSFDASILSEILPQPWAGTGIPASEDKMYALRRSWQWIKKLLVASMCESHSIGYGFCVSAPLRFVLYRALFDKSPADLFHIHILAVSRYAERNRQGNEQAFVDKLYHVVGLWQSYDAISGHPHPGVILEDGDIFAANHGSKGRLEWLEEQFRNATKQEALMVHSSLVSEQDAWLFFDTQEEVLQQMKGLAQTHGKSHLTDRQ